MDEYAARGKVALFTKELEVALLQNAEPSQPLSIEPAGSDNTSDASSADQQVVILEGELVAEPSVRETP
jgi:hypothetical protein